MKPPLHGLCLLNTRPFEQGQALNAAIREAGGDVIHVPMLSIEPTATQWLKDLPPAASIQHAIFISANAINYFFKALEKTTWCWSLNIQTTVIGKACRHALATWHVPLHHMPPIADSEHVLELSPFQHVKGQTILLIKGEGGRMDIEQTLQARGANLIALAVYQRGLPHNIDKSCLQALWHQQQVNIILFTSQQSMYHLLALCGEAGKAWFCQTPCIVLSERLAQTARHLGVQTVIVSHYDALLATLIAYNQKHAP